MKKYYKILFMLIILIFPGIGDARTYFLDCVRGNDNYNNSFEKPWKTISKVNRFKFNNGDVLKLKRGCVWKDTTIKSPGVNDFTIEDYGIGDLPLLDGNSIQPIYIKDHIENLTIRNINISGQNWKLSKAYNLLLENVRNVTIEGIFGDGENQKHTGQGKHAIGLINCSGTLKIAKSYLKYWGPNVIPSNAKDIDGIVILNAMNSSITITENRIHNINSDCVYLEKSTGDIKIRDNILYNAGENAIDCKGVQGLDISSNEIFRDNGFVGFGGERGERNVIHPFIVIHYEPYSLFASKNVTIYNNVLRDMPYSSGIVIYGNWKNYVENISIYNNNFKNIRGAIRIDDFSRKINVIKNVIEDMHMVECNSGDCGSIYVNTDGNEIIVSRNKIRSLNNNAETGIFIYRVGKNSSVTNNRVEVDKQNAVSYPFYCNSKKNIIINNNIWINRSSKKRVRVNNKSFTIEDATEWNKIAPGDMFDLGI